MNGGQRRGAHSIQRYARPMQVERIRDAIGDAGSAAGNSHTLPTHTGFGAKQLVFAVHHADIHTHLSRQIVLVRRLQARARVSRVLDRHPGMLQKQPLLRIYILRFFGGNVEKQRIKFIHCGNKSAPFAVMAPVLRAIFAKVFSPVPSLSGHFNDAVFPFAQIAPIGLDIDGFGVAPAQPNNRDWIGFCCWARSAAQTAKASS